MLPVPHTIEIQARGWNKCNGYHSQCATNRQVELFLNYLNQYAPLYVLWCNNEVVSLVCMYVERMLRLLAMD